MVFYGFVFFSFTTNDHMTWPTVGVSNNTAMKNGPNNILSTLLIGSNARSKKKIHYERLHDLVGHLPVWALVFWSQWIIFITLIYFWFSLNIIYLFSLQVLIAVGRDACTDKIGLDKVGVKVNPK